MNGDPDGKIDPDRCLGGVSLRCRTGLLPFELKRGTPKLVAGSEKFGLNAPDPNSC
jgi:hypothetical protein